ncbi:MAG TPA: polysialyltransferase family glycosyltransferase [Propionibacteriaceae bacterium]|nr:polysialyltransferase family glycosyltransferase [Propionibacteriaceae bacterium]
MTSQVFVVTTAFGLAAAAAALDDQLFEDAERRILVLGNNATVPETTSGPAQAGGAEALLTRFDDVYDYNELIAPQHPSLWRPRGVDLPLLQRSLSAQWSLTEDIHLVLESIHVPPALTLCRIFPDARIDVYAEGLMSYGPTRSKLPLLVTSRIERLLHLDLVPGLTPVLLTERGVRAQTISTSAFRRVVAEMGTAPPVLTSATEPVAVVLGQYLSSLGILTAQEETELHLEMVRGAVGVGYRLLVFKPHPSAPPVLVEPLLAEAARLGVSLTVFNSPELVETWFSCDRVGCVIGCFSTALMTAATVYGVPAARVGTELVLERLRPYQNSNRIPATIIDAALPPVSQLAMSNGTVNPATAPGSQDGAELADLTRLVQAVSYCMQPVRYPELRPVARALLACRFSTLRRYFKRRRLTKLDLPGRLPERRHRVPRTVRVALRRTLGPTVTNQVHRMLPHPPAADPAVVTAAVLPARR